MYLRAYVYLSGSNSVIDREHPSPAPVASSYKFPLYQNTDYSLKNMFAFAAPRLYQLTCYDLLHGCFVIAFPHLRF